MLETGDLKRGRVASGRQVELETRVVPEAVWVDGILGR